jgi:histidyl-tRNA synthetase
MERVTSLMKASGTGSIPAPPVFIAAIGKRAEEEGLVIADRLRQKGVWVELGYSVNSLKSQMRRADRLSAGHVIIIGEDEIRSGRIKWKRLSDSAQGEMTFSEAEEFFGQKG